MAVIALHVFLAIHAITSDTFDGFSEADVIASQLIEALFQGGLLLGAAAAVHLLAPPPEAD